MGKQTLVKAICPTTTQEWIKNGALLVDVREKDEVAVLAYDVPNIINIPLTEFDERFTEIPQSKDIVVVGSNPNKSLRAAGFLINHGYSSVVKMKHGLERWVQKGFPTVGDTSTVLNSDSCCPSSSCC